MTATFSFSFPLLDMLKQITSSELANVMKKEKRKKRGKKKLEGKELFFYS